MASLVKTYEKQKLYGQVYTPAFIVEKMLDSIGFDQPGALGRSILDPACGDGRFLVEVVSRIIDWSAPEKIAYNLSFVHGWDLDADAVKACIGNLNELIAPLNIEVRWNIRCLNSLEQIPVHNLFDGASPAEQFDFIVGNPPYIRIQHLDESQRRLIQRDYQFCGNGSTDIYVAFYELCSRLLKPTGVCALITPNTFFYTETARPLRAWFEKNQNIRSITNYGDIQIFENATTYSAILVFDWQRRPSFEYEEAYTRFDFFSSQIRFEQIKKGRFWQLSGNGPLPQGEVKLKDICKIHVGVTTLCDKAYIFPARFLDDAFALAQTKFTGEVKLERGILQPIVKASTLKSSDQLITEYMLFPYQKKNGKHQLIPEAELKAKFPLAYQYLLAVKPQLDQRDNGKPNSQAWYAFGRSQGLDTSFGKKILFSPMNNRPKFILFEREDCTFYSGYCIKFEGDHDWLLTQLNSERMAEFISVSSRDFRGGWKAYNKKVVQEFTLESPPNYLK